MATMEYKFNLLAVWNQIGHGHCTYRGKGYIGHPGAKRCSHPNAVFPECQFKYCPLVQPRYVMVRQEAGDLFLVVKKASDTEIPVNSPEWEVVELPTENQDEARKIVESYLEDNEIETDIREIVLRRFGHLFEVASELRRITQGEIEGVEEEE